MRIFGVCLMAALSLCLAGRSPASAVPVSDIPTGSYRDSCLSIQMQGDMLYARCQDVNGNWNNTQLDTEDCPGGPVANNNGSLACGQGGYGIANSMPRGSWRASCRDASQDGLLLQAQCDNGSGDWNTTSIDLANCPSRLVDNSRGNLVCRGGYAYALPGGSWRTTCRNGSMNGSVVSAECNDGYGSWRAAAFDLRYCPSGRLGNAHGTLICEDRFIGRWPQ